MNFVLPGNRTIAKIVLSGDWFSTKMAIYDFWISKVLLFSYLMLKKGQNCTNFTRFRSIFWKAIKYDKSHWWVSKMIQRRGFGFVKQKKFGIFFTEAVLKTNCLSSQNLINSVQNFKKNHTILGGFFVPWSFITLKNSHQDLSNDQTLFWVH